MRLGLTLFFAFFLIVGLAAYFVMRVFVDEVKPGVRQAMESTLVDAANVLAELVARDLKDGRIGEGDVARELRRASERELDVDIWGFAKHRIAYRITLTDARGIVVYDSRGLSVGEDHSRWNDVHRTLRGRYGARSSPETPGDDTHSVMYVAAPVYDPDTEAREIMGVLTLSQPNRAFEPFIRASQRSIVSKGSWLIILSALVGLLMSWWLAHGIARLNRYAQAVSADELAEPPPRRNDEIGDLGVAIEAMRQKLEGKRYVEHYVQSLTHEMKSPLSAIRGAAELLQEPLPEQDRARFAGHILTQERRLTETIEKLLALAEVEQHGWLERKTLLDPRLLLEEALASAEPAAKALGVRLVLEPSSLRTGIEGDAFLLRRALASLVDNALAFSDEGEEVRLSLERDARTTRFVVRDEGPGVPEYALPRVFERFYSLARPRTQVRSSGLGLPFVREVARLHGGSITLENRDEGGAEAVLSLPSA